MEAHIRAQRDVENTLISRIIRLATVTLLVGILAGVLSTFHSHPETTYRMIFWMTIPGILFFPVTCLAALIRRTSPFRAPGSWIYISITVCALMFWFGFTFTLLAAR